MNLTDVKLTDQVSKHQIVGHEIYMKCSGMQLADMNLTDQVSRRESDKHENGGKI